METSFKIDFIGIGAAKSGTTWLADNLRRHPQIFIPEKKELIYFNKIMPFGDSIENYRYEKPVDWYHSFFEKAKPGDIKGEISPQYFMSPEAVEKIHQYRPDIKLLAILRNPVERAFSSYLFAVQIGAIKAMPFEDAIKKQPSIISQGYYSMYLQKYFDRFKRENIKILIFENIKTDPETLYKDVLKFLNVDEYLPDSLRERSNNTKVNKNQFLNYVITSTRNLIHKHHLYFLIPLLRYSGISPLAEYIRDKLNVVSQKNTRRFGEDSMKMLRDCYSEEIERLEKLIDMDLSHWKAR